MPNEFSPSDAQDVLRRAALLQAQGEHDPGVGLSLDEVKRAARAAGIDARYVEQAVLGGGEHVAPSPPFLGVETGVQRVRVVPGQVSEHEWGRMVMALRREFGADGEAETLGGTRQWKVHQTRVTLEPDGPNTRITASSDWSSDVRGSLITSIGYVLFSAVLGGVAALNGAAAPAWLAVGILVLALLQVAYAYGPLRKRAKTRPPQLGRALDALARLAGSDERAAARTDISDDVGDASPDARVDASLLDAPPPDAGPPARRSRLRE